MGASQIGVWPSQNAYGRESKGLPACATSFLAVARCTNVSGDTPQVIDHNWVCSLQRCFLVVGRVGKSGGGMYIVRDVYR